MPVIRWMIKTADRVGMIQDVVKVFSAEGVSVRSMEVAPGKIFIKFNVDGVRRQTNGLRTELLTHQDVLEVVDIELQPHEQKKKELQAILESASDGIIGMDADGTIRYCNAVAAKLFSVAPERAVGLPIEEVAGEQTELRELLKGEIVDDRQVSGETNGTRVCYVCSGRPIRNETNQIIGAVASVKSMKAVQKLAHSMLQNRTVAFGDIVHASSQMNTVIELAKKTALSRYTVLIRGETGTGKELFARAIHEASLRNRQPFAPVNCAALPEALLESELFGYEGGAFSGAKKEGKIGLFESANQGTLFLDEIGELSLILQGKLLRVIQEGMIRRIGSNRQIPVDVRIVAATNRNLEEMVELKQFREDLYYRINVIPLNIPPLRERADDIPLLLDYFHRKYCDELGKRLEFSPEAYQRLLEYAWPGNVRELQNVVVRAIHLSSGEQIAASDLLIAAQEETAVLREGSGGDLKRTLEETEKELLEKALAKHGSARGAAREVGLSHTAVMNKIRRYQLEHLLATAGCSKRHG